MHGILYKVDLIIYNTGNYQIIKLPNFFRKTYFV